MRLSEVVKEKGIKSSHVLSQYTVPTGEVDTAYQLRPFLHGVLWQYPILNLIFFICNLVAVVLKFWGRGETEEKKRQNFSSLNKKLLCLPLERLIIRGKFCRFFIFIFFTPLNFNKKINLIT